MVITSVHETYCPKCPSHRYPSDPESEDIEQLPEGIRQMFVFPCAWRNEKLCKGVCEKLNYIESKHADLLMRSRANI